MSIAIGIDVGTSGVRSAAVDGDGKVLARALASMPAPEKIAGRPAQDPQLWWDTAKRCLQQCAANMQDAGHDPLSVGGIAVDGTSGTMLICDASLRPLTLGLMYNSANFDDHAHKIEAHAPQGSLARGHSSALARLLHLQAEIGSPGRAAHALHQADWIAARLSGTGGNSDWNNSLKTGYDPVQECWPAWLEECGASMRLLPDVHEPGTQIGTLRADLAAEFGMPAGCRLHAGTTDSTAAFLASGACSPGHAASSLGTTLAVKVLADNQVTDLASGVYSHRIGGAWLPGGASNTGGAVLLEHFSAEQIAQMTPALNPDQPTGLEYYPLAGPGERFPVNDARMQPKMAPRPADDTVFFQAILEGIAAVEKMAYRRMEELGALRPSLVYTSGGGAKNEKWMEIRRRVLGLEVRKAHSTDAAVGTARLAFGPVRF